MRDGNAPKRQYTDEFKIETVRLWVAMRPLEDWESPLRH